MEFTIGIVGLIASFICFVTYLNEGNFGAYMGWISTFIWCLACLLKN